MEAQVSTSVDGLGRQSVPLQYLCRYNMPLEGSAFNEGRVFLFGWGFKLIYFLWLGRPHGRALRTDPEWGEGSLERTAQSLSLPICKESA